MAKMRLYKNVSLFTGYDYLNASDDIHIIWQADPDTGKLSLVREITVRDELLPLAWKGVISIGNKTDYPHVQGDTVNNSYMLHDTTNNIWYRITNITNVNGTAVANYERIIKLNGVRVAGAVLNLFNNAMSNLRLHILNNKFVGALTCERLPLNKEYFILDCALWKGTDSGNTVDKVRRYLVKGNLNNISIPEILSNLSSKAFTANVDDSTGKLHIVPVQITATLPTVGFITTPITPWTPNWNSPNYTLTMKGGEVLKLVEMGEDKEVQSATDTIQFTNCISLNIRGGGQITLYNNHITNISFHSSILGRCEPIFWANEKGFDNTEDHTTALSIQPIIFNNVVGSTEAAINAFKLSKQSQMLNVGLSGLGSIMALSSGNILGAASGLASMATAATALNGQQLTPSVGSGIETTPLIVSQYHSLGLTENEAYKQMLAGNITITDPSYEELSATTLFSGIFRTGLNYIQMVNPKVSRCRPEVAEVLKQYLTEGCFIYK